MSLVPIRSPRYAPPSPQRSSKVAKFTKKITRGCQTTGGGDPTVGSERDRGREASSEAKHTRPQTPAASHLWDFGQVG